MTVSTTEPSSGAQVEVGASPVSTGWLPVPERVRALMYAAHERFATNDEGENSDIYPALANVSRDLFGICVAATDGAIYAVGDAEYPFTIMSVSKPFVFALVCQALGAEEARAKLGVNATGLPFNSVMAVEMNADRLTNPMVNSGALAATSFAPGDTAAEKWRFIRDGLSRFAGRARPQRRGLRLGVGHQPPQPGHRPPALEL